MDDPDWEWTDTRIRPDLAEHREERAECCYDTARYVAEIPRQRQLSPTRIVDLAPARFRLCAHHADVLLISDPEARVYEIRSAHDRD